MKQYNEIEVLEMLEKEIDSSVLSSSEENLMAMSNGMAFCQQFRNIVKGGKYYEKI